MHANVFRCTFLLVFSLTVSAEIKNRGFWKHDVFYQVYPRSFKDSDGDGIGDLNGITSNLEHMVDAGVQGIWLSPINKSPMIDFGYDISDFVSIDPMFGTIEDFKALMARARELGIKVVLDFVPNHTSDKHEWFQKSLAGDEKYKDYYVWRYGRNNNKDPPNNWLSAFGGPAWQYSDSRKLWYLHQFEYRQPDLNFSNPDVREEMKNVLRFWLDVGIDGFRIDSFIYFYENDELKDEPRSYLPGVTDQQEAYLEHVYTRNDPRNYDLLQSWREVLDQYADEHNDDEKILMTEAYTDLNYTMLMYDYGSNIPFNFKLITDVDSSSQPSDYKRVIDGWLNNMPEGAVANWVIGNHDRPRIESQVPGRSDQLNMLIMILPGVAVTYYGEEIGMVGNTDISWEATQDPQACNAGKALYQNFTRDPSRTPFQWDATKNAGFSAANSTWLPVNKNYKTLNLANEKQATKSHYKVYQALTKLRKESPALMNGSTSVVVLNDDHVLAVIRETNGQTVVLLMNFLDTEVETVDLSRVIDTESKERKVAVASSNSDIDERASVDLSRVTIEGKGAVVIVLNKH